MGGAGANPYTPPMPAPDAPPPPADPAPPPPAADPVDDAPAADDAPVELKNRAVAGLLAAAVPGLGHLYQGRLLKAGIYSVCILGLFCCGQVQGGWQAVAVESNAPGVSRGGGDFEEPGADPFTTPFGPPRRQWLQHYTAQVFAGAVAWPALVQNRRFYSSENVPLRRLEGPLDDEFRGVLVADFRGRPVVLADLEGRAALAPRGGGSAVDGTLAVTAVPPTDPRRRTGFEGLTDVVFPPDPPDTDPRNIELTPTTVRAVDRPIDGEPGRLIKLLVDGAALNAVALPGGTTADEFERPRAVGTVPRPLYNWYLAPMDVRAANRLHADLGTKMDLAVVFTMIAGLLNVLAFWDAVDGPAYGRTDALPPEPDADAEKK